MNNEQDQTNKNGSHLGRALVWIVVALLVATLWFFLARVALYFNDIWRYVAVPVAAIVGFFATLFFTVLIIPKKLDENDKFTNAVGTVLLFAAAIFAVSATFAPDWWVRSVSGPQQIISNFVGTKPSIERRRTEASKKAPAAATGKNRNASSSSDGEETFVFYQVKRRSIRTYQKSDCQLPHDIKEIVTPISCDNVETRDLFIVSQHLCFINKERVTPIKGDQYLSLSKYETTSRSVAKELRKRTQSYPEAYFEGRKPNMIDKFYDALHGKKNEMVYIFENGADLRKFQRNWDDLKELRTALRDVGCAKDRIR